MFLTCQYHRRREGWPLRESVVLLIAVTCVSCSGTQSTHGREALDSISRKVALPSIAVPAPAPGTCNIVGTIMTVDTLLASRSTEDPCASVPCEAIVRIDSVLGYGSAFPGAVGVGQTVRVHFRFTLASTEKLFPSMRPPYPGLSVGSRFSASLEASPDHDASNATAFAIGSYSVR